MSPGFHEIVDAFSANCATKEKNGLNYCVSTPGWHRKICWHVAPSAGTDRAETPTEPERTLPRANSSFSSGSAAGHSCTSNKGASNDAQFGFERGGRHRPFSRPDWLRFRRALWSVDSSPKSGHERALDRSGGRAADRDLRKTPIYSSDLTRECGEA